MNPVATQASQPFELHAGRPQADGTPKQTMRLDAMDRTLTRINELSHMLAAFWLVAIAVVICGDVLSRALFNAPFVGTAEIVANSVVSIVFLQLPSAVRSGGMLRAEILDPYLRPRTLTLIQALGSLLGAILFVAVAASAWEPMVEAWKISEYAGNESTVEIPLSPIRTLLVVMSLLGALNFLLMAVTGVRSVREGKSHG